MKTGVTADNDLLFGLVALQNGLIDQSKLVAAFQAWTLEKGRSLAEHLVARGDLDDDDRAVVLALVARHVKKHGGSPEKSLAVLPLGPSARKSLRDINDSDLATSLAVLAPSTDGDDFQDRLTEPTIGHSGMTLSLTDPDDGPSPRAPETDVTLDGAASRYHLLGEIARGGMGAVFKARDPGLGRDLALKILLDQHRQRADLVDRFVEEAQICGQLQHPGVVPVYELGNLADQRPFFTMKLVKGQTLAALLAERTDGDLPRFLAIFEAICQTVAYAHSRGVIHRDLKPSNVMVGSFGEVQVMDWGLAKVLPRDAGAAGEHEPAPNATVVGTLRSQGDSDISQAGTVLGTPAYMAPEQARGETDVIDRRADVFALGSILCEVLTGRPAFGGGSAGEILAAAARGETSEALDRLAACQADPELLTLARDCLAAERAARPADAGVVAARITAS
jgi:tRNA A-37 threonylcarbamoyl transferase component Bud32